MFHLCVANLSVNWMFSSASVCQHDNFRTSKHTMMKLGGYVQRTKISTKFEFGGHSSPGCAFPKCGVGLRRWKNQRSAKILKIG